MQHFKSVRFSVKASKTHKKLVPKDNLKSFVFHLTSHFIVSTLLIIQQCHLITLHADSRNAKLETSKQTFYESGKASW